MNFCFLIPTKLHRLAGDTVSLTNYQHHPSRNIQGVPKKVPSIEIRPFVLNVRCDTLGN